MYYVVRIILLTMMMMMSEATSTAAESASESNPEGSTTGSTSNSGRRLLFGQRTTSSGSSGRQQQHRIHSLVSALSFESVFRRKTKVSVEEGESTMNVSDSVRVQTRNMLHGTLDPDGSVEVVFYDALEFGDGEDRNSFSVNFRQRESVVMERIRTTRGGGGGGGGYRESIEASYLELDDVEDSTEFDDKEGNALADPSSAFVPPPPPSSMRDRSLSPRSMRRASAICQYRPPPPPPEELPLRFLRAGKGNVEEGVRRYEATLAWRRDQKIDTILREPEPAFDLIKQHYPHFLCGKGKNGEPIFMEQPPKTNLKALREGGVTLESLLRHYLRVTEFQWQYVIRDDLQHSIYIIDLDGMRLGDFVGEVVDFVKRASYLSAQHYPERAGFVFVINVPGWFQLIWKVLKPLVDESTLEKIYILRGADEIRDNMLQRIDLESIPKEYGGEGPALADTPEEAEYRDLMEHNSAISRGEVPCAGMHGNPPCKWCNWQQPRSY